MKNKKLQKNKGFTLIETLVAIFILVISITGPMTAAQNSLKASFLARDQIVAFYLAQDAIEFIKNYRDNSSIDGNDWRDVNFDSNTIRDLCFGGDKQCNVDTFGNKFYACDTGDLEESLKCPRMDLNEYGFFVEPDGSPDTKNSKYTRSIFMNTVPDNSDETEIVVVVEWDTSLFLAPRRIIVQENIYNWLNSD